MIFCFLPKYLFNGLRSEIQLRSVLDEVTATNLLGEATRQYLAVLEDRRTGEADFFAADEVHITPKKACQKEEAKDIQYEIAVARAADKEAFLKLLNEDGIAMKGIAVTTWEVFDSVCGHDLVEYFTKSVYADTVSKVLNLHKASNLAISLRESPALLDWLVDFFRESVAS